MLKQEKFINNEPSDEAILTDVLYCTKRGDYFRIKYEIEFLLGDFKGQTKTIIADLDEIELNCLDGYLVENGYLTEYTNQQDYFEVKTREVFVGNWVYKDNII